MQNQDLQQCTIINSYQLSILKQAFYFVVNLGSYLTLKKTIILTGLFLFITGIILLLTRQEIASYFLITGLSLTAINFHLIQSLKLYAFTVWIFTAVSLAMFYPWLFTDIGGLPMKSFIVPLLQLIMFGVGSTMGFKDFEGVIRMPKPVFIGIVCQFTIMPLIGFFIAKTFGFPPEIAAGIILIGSVPSGLASNVMSYLANANVALSVTLTSVATLLAPLITPFLMHQLAGSFIQVDFLVMMKDITGIVILPIGAGLLFNHLLGRKFPWLDRVMPMVSMISIAAIITIITASGRDSLLEVGLLLVLACLLHNLSGYLLGYFSSKIFGMDERSCRTIAIEVGLQNGGLASGLAISMGKLVALAPAVFGPLMNITGSMLASYWHNRTVDDKSAD